MDTALRCIVIIIWIIRIWSIIWTIFHLNKGIDSSFNAYVFSFEYSYVTSLVSTNHPVKYASKTQTRGKQSWIEFLQFHLHPSYPSTFTLPGIGYEAKCLKQLVIFHLKWNRPGIMMHCLKIFIIKVSSSWMIIALLLCVDWFFTFIPSLNLIPF